MVKIYNRNQYDYQEKYRDKMVMIPSGGFIEMDYEEANRFLGKMPEFKRLKDGQQDPRSYKWLEMDKDDRRRVEMALRNEADEKSKKVFVCHACKKEFEDKKELLKHVKKEHMSQLEEKAREELET